MQSIAQKIEELMEQEQMDRLQAEKAVVHLLQTEEAWRLQAEIENVQGKLDGTVPDYGYFGADHWRANLRNLQRQQADALA